VLYAPAKYGAVPYAPAKYEAVPHAPAKYGAALMPRQASFLMRKHFIYAVYFVLRSSISLAKGKFHEVLPSPR